MQCPRCGARSSVSEKRGPFRGRRCTNAACRYGFMTREDLILQPAGATPCLRTRATQAELATVLALPGMKATAINNSSAAGQLELMLGGARTSGESASRGVEAQPELKSRHSGSGQ